MTDDKTVIETPLNQKLIEAREAKGLSEEDVCIKLKLSHAQLNKLESEALIPAELTFFERGYVRNYAVLLELEPADYECFFPEGSVLNNQLHSVKRYSVPVGKPLWGSFFVKILLTISIMAAVGFLIMSIVPTLIQPESVAQNMDRQLEVPEQIEYIELPEQIELPK